MAIFLQSQHQSAVVEWWLTVRSETSGFDAGTKLAARTPGDRPLPGVTPASSLERNAVPDSPLGRALISLKRYFSGHDEAWDWSPAPVSRQNDRFAHRADGGEDVATHTGAAASPSWGDRATRSAWGSWQ